VVGGADGGVEAGVVGGVDGGGVGFEGVEGVGDDGVGISATRDEKLPVPRSYASNPPEMTATSAASWNHEFFQGIGLCHGLHDNIAIGRDVEQHAGHLSRTGLIDGLVGTSPNKRRELADAVGTELFVPLDRLQ